MSIFEDFALSATKFPLFCENFKFLKQNSFGFSFLIPPGNFTLIFQFRSKNKMLIENH